MLSSCRRESWRDFDHQVAELQVRANSSLIHAAGTLITFRSPLIRLHKCKLSYLLYSRHKTFAECN